MNRYYRKRFFVGNTIDFYIYLLINQGDKIKILKNYFFLEYEKEIIYLEQIQELKTICTPAQLNKFEDLMEEMKEYFMPKKPAPRK